MSFLCDQCNKSFSFRNNLYRHKKNTCKLSQNPVILSQNPVILPSKSDRLSQNPVILSQNPVICDTPLFRVVDGYRVQCIQCEKLVSNKKNFSRHQSVCKGCPTRVCRHCSKQFKDGSNISRHEKRCFGRFKDAIVTSTTISAAVATVATGPNTTVHNHHHHHHHQTVVVNNHIVNHNQIVLNMFGVESWDYLCLLCDRENKPEFDRVKNTVLTEGVDGLCKVIEGHYFNKDYPQNHTIRKTIKNNDFVEVHVGNNEWEPKTLDTAMEEIKNTTSMYIRPMVDDVMDTEYHHDERMKQVLNKTFTDVLVPMRYEMCGEYTHKLSDIDIPASHMLQQQEQINRRKIKTMLFEFSKRLISLSRTI
jgi:hypothetical protein